MPEIDVHRRTTKVNFGIIGSLVLFFVIAGAAIIWFASHRG